MKIKLIFIKFILVGILNTIFGYSIFALFLYFGMHYALALFSSTILGIIFNFQTTGLLVFKNKENKLLLKFIAVYAIIYAMSVSLLKIANVFQINLYFAGFITTGLTAVISFVLNKKWVFKGQI